MNRLARRIIAGFIILLACSNIMCFYDETQRSPVSDEANKNSEEVWGNVIIWRYETFSEKKSKDGIRKEIHERDDVVKLRAIIEGELCTASTTSQPVVYPQYVITYDNEAAEPCSFVVDYNSVFSGDIAGLGNHYTLSGSDLFSNLSMIFNKYKATQ